MSEYKCDTARLLRKGDIYNCDLGENGDIQDSGLLAKSRPCLIVSSNTMNGPKQYIYQVAPIRTEHVIEVNEDTTEYIVSERRKQGRIYVPIEMRPGDFRFIDITQMRPIHISRIGNYSGSIINEELMTKINAAIMELYFDKDELISSCSSGYNHSIETVIEDEIVEELPVLIEEIEEDVDTEEFTEIEPEEPKKKKNKGGRKQSFPMGFSKYYELYKRGEITVTQLAKKLDKGRGTIYYYIKKYEELHPEVLTKK